MRWLITNWAWVHKSALFVTGLTLFVWEATLRIGPTRPEFLIVYMGMMGLPAFIGVDNARAMTRPPDNQESPPT